MNDRPALKVIIPYTLGIYLAGFLSIPLVWMWLIAFICLIAGANLAFARMQRPRLSHLLLLFAIFTGGALRLSIVQTSPIPVALYDQPVRFSGQMLYQPDQGELWEEGYATGTIQSVATPALIAKAKLLLRFREPVALHYGDYLEIEGELRQPKGKRNPGGFDYRSYLARRQVFGILYPHRNQEIVPMYRSGFPPLRWMESLRHRVESVIDGAYREQPDHIQIIKGMFLGKRSGFPEELIVVFRNSGTLHILVVSGSNVGLIAAVCFLIFSLLHFSRTVTCMLTIAAVVIFACLVGFGPSVLRASLTAILFLIAMLLDRDVDLINLLAFVALLLLLFNPAQLWDVGFQLTFAATGAIVYFLPKWNRFTARILSNRNAMDQIPLSVSGMGWARVVRWVVAAFGVSLSAQVGTSLIIAQNFYRVYPLSLVANLFAVGLAGPIVSITLISVLIGLIWLPLATPFAYANHLFIFIFLKIIEFFGHPWGVIKTPPPSFGFIFVYIAGCLAIAHWGWVWERRRKAALIGLAALAIGVGDTAWHDRGKLLEVTFLDVGQGDAAFVRFPDGKTMLIDGGLNMRGYDSGERILDPFLCHEGVRKLDLLVLSHPDNDHGGGFEHVLREFKVKGVLGVPHRDLPPPTHQALHEIIDAKGIPHEHGYAGVIDLTSTARLELLQPLDEASTNLMDADVNDDSLVLKITYGGVRILFTGDIERGAEERLITSGRDPRAEIIKVPHHGSKTSSSAEFLDAVRPGYAIFSLGERNKFNFPSEEVVVRYRERGCRVLRTDQLGAIRLRTDGRRCWITHDAGR